MMTADQPHDLYRLFSDDSELLYIGITHDFDTRLRLHLSKSMPEGSRVTGWETIQARYARHHLETYPDRATSHEAEKAAIRAERPLLNVHFNTGRVWRNRPVKVKTVVLDDPGTTPLTALGYHLGRAMVEAGHTTQTLAEAAKVPPAQLAKCLLGHGVRMAVIVWAAAALDMKTSDLLATAEESAA